MGLIKDILRTMDYGPSPESTEHVGVWLEEHKAGFGHFINGVFTKPGALFDVFNPARGERIARVSQGSPKDIDAAVASLRTKGVKFNRYPGMGQDRAGVWSSPSGARIAWFSDPDGNTLSLTEL